MKKTKLFAFLNLVSVAILFFVQTPLAHAWAWDAEWVDRAHIKVKTFKFDRGDENDQHGGHELSSEAGHFQDQVSVEALQNAVNAENGNGKIYTRTGALLSETHEYKTSHCNGKTGSEVAIDMGSGGMDSSDGDFAIGWATFTGDDGDITTTKDFEKCNNVVNDRGAQVGVHIGAEGNRNIWFRYVDDKTIKRVDDDKQFKKLSDEELNKEVNGKKVNEDKKEKFYALEGEETCADFRGDSEKKAYVQIVNSSPADIHIADYETCTGAYEIQHGVGVADVANVKKKGTGLSGTNPNGDDGSGAEKPDITCETELLNPLTWIVCPLVDAAKLAVQQFDNAITQRLKISTSGQDSKLDLSGDYGKGFYKAWGTFRYFALIMLVIIGLVMVLAQAGSFDFVDAYTIKKVMPRLFIAVILITLSWSLCLFAIDISNAVGVGVRSIIYAPFSGVHNANVDNGAAALLNLGVGGALASLGLLGIGSFALTALLAVIIGFGVIVFREMLILFLVTTVPLALVCWILPNTQRAWKMWWDFFTKALLAFPLITMMIAVGHVFSKIAISADPGLLGTTISFICYFGPYFMIPTAFKLAGGAIATISGAVGDKSRGGFDRLKNYRTGQRQKNALGLKEGTRWQGNKRIPGSQRLASRVGKITQGASTGLGGQFGLGERGKLASDAALSTMAEEKAKSKEWQGHMYKDDVMRALTYDDARQAEAAMRARYAAKVAEGKMTQAEADTELKRTMIAANQIGFGRASQVAAASQLAMNKSGYDDAADAAETVQRVGGGNASLEGSVREKVKFIGKGVGRNDLGALEHASAEDLADPNAREAWNDRITLKGAETADGATLARNHAKGLENIAKATQRTLDRDGGHGPKTAEQQERYDRAGKVAGALDDSKAWATLGNTSNIDDTSKAAGSELAGSRTVETPTGRQFVEDEVVNGFKTGRQVITPETESRQVDESLLSKNKARVVGDPSDPRNQANQQNQNPPGGTPGAAGP